MGEKPVTDLAGVGDILGKRLTEAGFDKVRCCGVFRVPGRRRRFCAMFVWLCVCVHTNKTAAALFGLGYFE